MLPVAGRSALLDSLQAASGVVYNENLVATRGNFPAFTVGFAIPSI